MSRMADSPVIGSAWVSIDGAGEVRTFGLGCLIDEWPSAAAWLRALPEPLTALLDGSPRLVEVEAPDGEPHAFFVAPVAADDDSETALRVERPSHMSAVRLRAVFDLLDDMVWSVDRRYRLTAFNRHFAKVFFGLMRVHPRLGESALSYARNALNAQVWQDVYDRALSGERVTLEMDDTTLLRAPPVHMSLTASPIVTDGRVTGVACFLRDVTELRTQSRAIHRQNALLDALSRVQSRFIGQGQTVGIFSELLDVLLELTESPYGFLGETRWDEAGRPSVVVTAISDVSWDEASRARYLSAFAGEMVFSELDSLVGQVLTSERPVVSNDPAADARAGGVPAGHFEVQSFLGLPCRLGERLVGMVGVANREGGYDRSFVGFLKPLLRTLANVIEARHSERRRQEAELALQQAKEAAEKADRAKGEFLASMSHEIRTPLNAVMGLCELALDVAVDADQKSLLRAARTNSETLLNLISDILDFSRIDAGRIELDLAPFDLRRLVEDVAETMAIRAEPEGIAVVAAVQPQMPCPLVGDAHRVRQVLTNLVSNGVKYTPAGEVRIEVSAERAEDEVAVRIDVVDTGLGIAPEEHERIFERFHRVAATADVGGGGTGLGLSITRILVEHMQGSITVESALGEGSRFTVRLPLGLASDTLDDGPPAWILEDVRVGLVHPPTGDGPHIERLLTAFGATVQRFEDPRQVDYERVDVVLTREPVPGCPRPTVRLAPVSEMGKPRGKAPRLTRPIRRDALLDAVIAAAGLDRHMDRSPSLAPVPTEMHCAVLLVEDHPDNRAVARRHLERDGHTVQTAEHGGVAVELARETAFDVVLMDLHMPEVDGFEAVRRIRADEERMGVRPVPIVAVTAHATAAVRKRCFETGFDGFVAKPVTGRSLIEAVERFAFADPVALIVDDAPDSCRLLTRHLRRALDMRLRTAEDGARARDAVSMNPPQLALVDATLPDESGFEFAAWLREVAGQSVTIIMVTGRTDAEARRLAQEAGTDGFVTKPVDRRVLLSEIERHRGRARSPRPPANRPRALLLPNATADERSRSSAPPRDERPGFRSIATGPQITEPLPALGAALAGTSTPPAASQTPDTSPSAPVPEPAAPSTVEVAYVDPDLLDLIPPFLQDRRDDLAVIGVAVEKDDMKTIARLGHSMKGSGRAYGMPHVSALGRRIEQAAREGDMRALRRACGDLAEYVDSVRVLPEP